MNGSDGSATSDIPWEILRDAYTLHFGNLAKAALEKDLRRFGVPWATDLEADEVADASIAGVPRLTLDDIADAEVAYYALAFDAPAAGEVRTYATFGAARLTGGHEVFWKPAIRLGRMDEIFGRLVMRHAPLYPGKVIPQIMTDTPFHAVLLAPAEAGSISLGLIGGVERFALRVVPLTEAEHHLARKSRASLERLLGLLRAKGALDVLDPLRDCVLEPERSQELRAVLVTDMLENAELRLRMRKRRLRQVIKASAPPFLLEDVRAGVAQGERFVAYLRTKRVDPQSPAAVRVAQRRRLKDALEHALEGVRLLVADGMVPEAVIAPSKEIAAIALTTHPVAASLLHVVAGVDTSAAFDAEVVLEKVAFWICAFRPENDRASLLRTGRAALELAEKEAGDGAVVPPHAAWKAIVAAMCVERTYYPGVRGVVASFAIPSGIQIADCILAKADDRPPLERLRAVTKLILARMGHVARKVERSIAELPAAPRRRRAFPKKPTLH